MRRLLLYLVTVWCCSCVSVQAFAQFGDAGDYDTSQGDWNGMRDFKLLAESEQVELVFHDDLDLDTLNLDEPLLIIYPNQDLRSDSLSRYVVDGGRVILADDFGKSGTFLKRLDVSRTEPLRGTLPHDEFFQRNPALPVLRARGVHPLLEGVKVMVANHPAVLFNVGGPVMGYSQDGGLIYDMNLGDGKVIVIGDASLFINHMLNVADNGRFLRNALSYACQNKPDCRVHVYTREFTQSGSYGNDDDFFGDREEVSVRVEELNELLDEMMRQLPASQLFYYLGMLIAVGLVAYLVAIFPLRRTREYSAYVQDTLLAIHQPQSEFDWNLSRYSRANSATNYALPISILKELVEELVLKKMGLWELQGTRRPTVPEIAEQFARDYLANYPADERRKLERKFTDLLATFASVPTRQRIFLDADTFFGERDLLQLYTNSMEILDILDLKESYERRIRLHI